MAAEEWKGDTHPVFGRPRTAQVSVTENARLLSFNSSFLQNSAARCGGEGCHGAMGNGLSRSLWRQTTGKQRERWVEWKRAAPPSLSLLSRDANGVTDGGAVGHGCGVRRRDLGGRDRHLVHREQRLPLQQGRQGADITIMHCRPRTTYKVPPRELARDQEACYLPERLPLVRLSVTHWS